MHIRIVFAHVHPCTKFGVPRSKGVRARGQKAEQIKLPPGSTILTPRGWFTQLHAIQTKALLTWKFGLSATSRLGCSPDTTFFEGFTRRHVAHSTCHVAPRDRHHRRFAVPAHRMSRLPSGSAWPFRRYSRNPCLRWPLSRPSPTTSSVQPLAARGATHYWKRQYLSGICYELDISIGLCLIYLFIYSSDRLRDAQ